MFLHIYSNHNNLQYLLASDIPDTLLHFSLEIFLFEEKKAAKLFASAFSKFLGLSYTTSLVKFSVAGIFFSLAKAAKQNANVNTTEKIIILQFS